MMTTQGLRLLTLAAVVGLAAPALAEDAGAAIFKTSCAACHSLAKPPHNGIGPSLVGVVGRKAGTAPGFAFSRAMKAYGKVWGAANLDAYLAAPAKTVPGTSMSYIGLKDPARRASLIAYLKTQK